MANNTLILGLILGGCLSAIACGSDSDDTGAITGGSGGSGGNAGGSGHGGSIGNAGAAPGEAGAAPSEAGAPGEAGAGGAGGGTVVFPVALDPTGIIVPGATPSALKHVLVAGTDYTAQTEVVSVTLDPAAVGSTVTYMDGDAVPVSSAGLGFVLERSNDKIHLLDGGAIKTTFDVTDPGSDTAPLADNKAYATLYNKGAIAILDLAGGKVSRRIDLTDLNDPGDTDKSPDIGSGAYDSTAKIAYYTLARVDRNSITAPSYQLPCTTTKALLIGIDTTTDTLVDLNGAAAGNAIELSLVAPISASLSSDGKSLSILADGCYDASTLKHQGVEVVDLTAGTSKVAYAPTNSDFLTNLVLLGSDAALISGYDENGISHWYKLDLGTGTLGDELMGVPDSVSFDGTDLIGVQITGKVGALARYDLTNGMSTVISATTWSGQYSSASGTALVE